MQAWESKDRIYGWLFGSFVPFLTNLNTQIGKSRLAPTLHRSIDRPGSHASGVNTPIRILPAYILQFIWIWEQTRFIDKISSQRYLPSSLNAGIHRVYILIHKAFVLTCNTERYTYPFGNKCLLLFLFPRIFSATSFLGYQHQRCDLMMGTVTETTWCMSIYTGREVWVRGERGWKNSIRAPEQWPGRVTFPRVEIYTYTHGLAVSPLKRAQTVTHTIIRYTTTILFQVNILVINYVQTRRHRWLSMQKSITFNNHLV
jgi:hypothetical protein